MSTVSGIQGQILEITVVGCSKLRDTELFSRQDPYVCLEYAYSKFRTRTCTDGGRNPTFQEKFQVPLIEGLREINIIVWNSNTFTADDFIGSGRVRLQKVLSQGYDDSSWPIQTRSLKYAGEAKLIMHFPNAWLKKTAESSTRSSPPTPIIPYMAAAPPAAYVPPHAPSYPPPARTHPRPGAYGSYPPPDPALFAASAYQHQPHPPAMYPPQPYMQQYPPPPPTQPYYPPGPYHPGYYPPPY